MNNLGTVGTALWKDDRPSSRRPPLESDLDVDVAIIGAGYTGLWTAYYLRKEDPTLRIAVLEKECVGFGASGRNGGWASAIFPVSLARVAKLYDHQAALDLQEAMNGAVDEIGRATAKEGIDCSYAKEGHLGLARTKAQLARAKAAVAGSESFGTSGQSRLLGADEARSIINADGVLGANYTPHCAVIQPDHLVRGLATWLDNNGGTIYEDTTVTDIGEGTVHTNRGTVTAEVVVRATEGYTPCFPRFRRDVAPLYSLVVATAPLPQELREELGFTTRTAFNDMRNLRIYAQPTADDRLIFGGRGAPYHFNSRVDQSFEQNDRIHDGIVETMHDFFPQLRDVPVTHRWGGPLGVPRDWFPSVGFDRGHKLAWAGPYVGDGVATSNLAGRILRNLILNRDEKINSLPVVDHRSPKWEFEPLRWVGVNAGLAAAQVGDIEERLTSRPSTVSSLLEKLTGAH